MLLAVDVGNSHTVLGLFRGPALFQHWRLRTERGATADELARDLNGLLALRGLGLRSVQGLVVASVVPPLGSVWLEVAAAHLSCGALAAGPELDTGLRLEVERPAEVGPDRIADCLAAWRLHGAPVIVVDCGTATTVDAVGAGGRYLGGAIAPGVGLSYEVLVERTALLRRVELAAPTRALGATTAEQLLSGVVFGCAGQVDALVERIAAEMGGAERVVATGGWAPTIRDASRRITHLDPWLTLHGLRLIYELCPPVPPAVQDLPAGGTARRPNMARQARVAPPEVGAP